MAEIRLGGVFLEFQEKINYLSQKLCLTAEKLSMTEEDYNQLYRDRADLRAKWIATAQDLRLGTDTNTKLEEVFRQLRTTKEELERSSCFLSERVLYLESLVADLNGQNQLKSDLLDNNGKLRSQMEVVISVEKDENNTLRDLLYKREEEIERLQTVILGKQDEIEVINKSLCTKDRQLASVCKDRDRLKDSLESARKALLPRQRSEIDKPQNTDSTTVLISESRKENSRNRAQKLSHRRPLTSKESSELENFESYISEVPHPFDPQERQYNMMIRKLRLEIETLKSGGGSIVKK